MGVRRPWLYQGFQQVSQQSCEVPEYQSCMLFLFNRNFLLRKAKPHLLCISILELALHFSVGNSFDRKEYVYLCIILIEERVNILLLSKDITASGVSHSEIFLEHACPPQRHTMFLLPGGN